MVLFKEAQIRLIITIKHDGTIDILQTLTYSNTPQTDLAGHYSREQELIAILSSLNKIEILKKTDLLNLKTIDIPQWASTVPDKEGFI
jgi:hypothetical protein